MYIMHPVYPIAEQILIFDNYLFKDVSCFNVTLYPKFYGISVLMAIVYRYLPVRAKNGKA